MIIVYLFNFSTKKHTFFRILLLTKLNIGGKILLVIELALKNRMG